MKMKRILALLIAFVMCFALVACDTAPWSKNVEITEPETTAPKNTDIAPTASQEISKTDEPSPLLYRVTDQSGNAIWLFGSIHVGREDYYPLPKYVQNAFEQADSLAVELDIVAFEKDMAAQMKALAAMIYRDGTRISDHIPSELYDQCVEILTEYNTYMPALDMYSPAFWSSTIDSLMLEEFGGDAELGIDRNLIAMAYKADKKILEIETAEFQYKLLADLDDDVQTALLETSVESYKDKQKGKEELQELMDLWASGDEKAFAEYLAAPEEEMSEEEKQLYAKYNKAIVTDRNLTMTEFAEDALDSGKEVFICVGAAHIVGEGAMADLLARRGYTVECITK